MATLNYIGSKKTLLDFLDSVIGSLQTPDKVRFLDGFSGTGIVGKYFNDKYNYQIYSNDLEYYSWVINYALLKVSYSDQLERYIEELNALAPTVGLISTHYSEEGDEKRMFWTKNNAGKADAIIQKAQKMLEEEEIDREQYLFLLASLITSFDKVANTTSVYGAFLKKYKSSSLQDYFLKPIHKNKNIPNKEINRVFNLDIDSPEIYERDYDIVYLDPPYNNRQYSSNYHPLNFIARYDPDIIPYGKTGLLQNSNKSKFCIAREVEKAFSSLISNLRSTYILLSYNNEGLLSEEKIRDILSKKGKTTLYKYEYKKYKSSKTQKNETVFEFLYLCETNKKGDYSEEIVTIV